LKFASRGGRVSHPAPPSAATPQQTLFSLEADVAKVWRKKKKKKKIIRDDNLGTV
jgi:hypothetical protein